MYKMEVYTVKDEDEKYTSMRIYCIGNLFVLEDLKVKGTLCISETINRGMVEDIINDFIMNFEIMFNPKLTKVVVVDRQDTVSRYDYRNEIFN
ncbi:MAG: hypothetical protein ACRDA5_02335 [Clostridium sp.]